MFIQKFSRRNYGLIRKPSLRYSALGGCSLSSSKVLSAPPRSHCQSHIEVCGFGSRLHYLEWRASPVSSVLPYAFSSTRGSGTTASRNDDADASRRSRRSRRTTRTYFRGLDSRRVSRLSTSRISFGRRLSSRTCLSNKSSVGSPCVEWHPRRISDISAGLWCSFRLSFSVSFCFRFPNKSGLVKSPSMYGLVWRGNRREVGRIGRENRVPHSARSVRDAAHEIGAEGCDPPRDSGAGMVGENLH